MIPSPTLLEIGIVLRIGILGAARIARSFCNGVRGSSKVAVTAIASRSQASAKAFAKEFDIAKTYAPYEALLDDPDIDAIYNPLPNALHAPWSIRAAGAGKHVLCEKPFGATAADVVAMQAAARRFGVHIVEAYPYLAQPQTRLVRQLVRDGAIGDLRTIHALFTFPLRDWSDIRMDPSLGAGSLLDVGCYPLSLTRVLAGRRATRITAAADFTETGVDRTLAATLEYGDGPLAQISCSFAAANMRYALIIGDKGVIETHYLNHTTERSAEIRVKRSPKPDAMFETVTSKQMNGFLAEADSFADLIAGGNWTGATAQESLDIAEMLDAIAASARSRTPIELGA
ncbi:MAG: Gfo/Idh/MocA family oxidoreductase [Terricaulis silvestris]